jgi:hypothetical protein
MPESKDPEFTSSWESLIGISATFLRALCEASAPFAFQAFSRTNTNFSCFRNGT